MLHIISSETDDRMKLERACVILSRSQNEPHRWVLAKMPMNLIREVHAGAIVYLKVWIVEVDGTPLTTLGITVCDDPDAPVCIYGSCRSEGEVQDLFAVLSSGEFPMQLHNENGLPVLFAACKLDSEPTRSVMDLMTRSMGQDSNDRRRQANDAVEALLMGNSSPAVMASCSLRVNIETVDEIRLHIAGGGEIGLHKLGERDEGGELEVLTFQALEWMFPFGTFLNPCVGEGKRRRELCDVLAVSRVINDEDGSVFVVQNKVVSAGLNRPPARKAKTIRKNIMAGIRQLTGAIRDIQRGYPIFHADGTPIEREMYQVPYTKKLRPLDLRARAARPGHGIVLISDLYDLVDWNEVFAGLMGACRKTQYFCQVLDLQELGQIMTHSMGHSLVFEHLLVKRWEAMSRENTALVRMEFK